MYTEWRDPYFFPEIVYSEARTEWVENHAVQQVLRARRRAAARPRTSRRSRSRCSRCSTTSGRLLASTSSARMAGDDAAVVPLPLHPRRALRQLPARAVPRHVAGQAPVQGHDHRARRHRRPPGRRRSRRPASSSDTLDLHLVRQRARDGDVARRRVHAVPLRQGLDLGGRRAGARHRRRGRG